jgi:hypothetical protein
VFCTEQTEIWGANRNSAHYYTRITVQIIIVLNIIQRQHRVFRCKFFLSYILRPEKVLVGPNSSIIYVDNGETLTSISELYMGCSEFLFSVIFFLHKSTNTNELIHVDFTQRR